MYKMNNKTKKFGIILLTLFSIIGVIFSGILVVEGIHIWRLGTPKSLCYDFGEGTFMHQVNTEEIREYIQGLGMTTGSAFQMFEEKVAVVGGLMFMGFGWMFLGYGIRSLKND